MSQLIIEEEVLGLDEVKDEKIFYITFAKEDAKWDTDYIKLTLNEIKPFGLLTEAFAEFIIDNSLAENIDKLPDNCYRLEGCPKNVFNIFLDIIRNFNINGSLPNKPEMPNLGLIDVDLRDDEKTFGYPIMSLNREIFYDKQNIKEIIQSDHKITEKMFDKMTNEGIKSFILYLKQKYKIDNYNKQTLKNSFKELLEKEYELNKYVKNYLIELFDNDELKNFNDYFKQYFDIHDYDKNNFLKQSETQSVAVLNDFLYYSVYLICPALESIFGSYLAHRMTGLSERFRDRDGKLIINENRSAEDPADKPLVFIDQIMNCISEQELVLIRKFKEKFPLYDGVCISYLTEEGRREYQLMVDANINHDLEEYEAELQAKINAAEERRIKLELAKAKKAAQLEEKKE